MKTKSHKEKGEIRKSIYEYVETLGVTMNTEIHEKLKELILEHTNFDNQAIHAENEQLKNSLQEKRQGFKQGKLNERLKNKQCPVCGKAMIARTPYEFVTKCGHLSDYVIALA